MVSSVVDLNIQTISQGIRMTDLSEDQREVLKEFRASVADILKPEHDDKYLLRWLRARDFDLTKAEKMIRDSFQFRKKFQVDEILSGSYEEPEVFKKYKATGALGFDKDGSLLRLFRIPKVDFKGFMHSAGCTGVLKWHCYLFESDIKQMAEHNAQHGGEEEKFTYICDLQNFSLRALSSAGVANCGIRLLNMLQDNYPESLKTVYVINAPAYFSWVFNIFKPFMNHVTLNKFKIYPQGSTDWLEEIFKKCDPSLIPAFLGGLRTDPDGDPECKTVVKTGGKIPLSYYMNDKITLQIDDPEVNNAVIPGRSDFDYKVEVDEPGSKIKWEFQTIKHNIRFGVFYREVKAETEDDVLDELIAVENVECNIIPESGEFHCEKSGEYSLHFDNTYSWFTSKHLLFKVQINRPE